MALIHNVSFNQETRVLSLSDRAGNVISSCEVPSKGNELTLTATVNNSSVRLKKNGTLSNTYEVNTGSGWAAYEFETRIPLNAGQSCKWRCSSHPDSQSSSNYVQFEMTGAFEASGNCNSMLDGTNFSTMTSLADYPYALYCLFSGCASLTKTPELPTTTLANACYYALFKNTGLAKTPLLPATTLSTDCYVEMFSGSGSLKEVRIAATTIVAGALNSWLSNVSLSGDFYCDPNAVIFPTDSASGIPQNWTREDIANYPTTP